MGKIAEIGEGPESFVVTTRASVLTSPMAFLLIQQGMSVRAVFRLSYKEGGKNKIVIISAGGNRNRTDGSLNNVGSNGNYWSSTVDSTNSRNLNFNSSSATWNSNNRANGLSVRCLKDWFLPPSFLGYEYVF